MLNKPGKLTAEEIAMFQEHPDKGKRILDPIPFMRNLIDGCWCHHEQFDGSGYPRGLMKDNIPLLGRMEDEILACFRDGGGVPYERFERSLGDADDEVREQFYARNFEDLMGSALSS